MSLQKQYGLIGFPLGHSFSQSFFSKKFEDEGIDAVYSNFEIENISKLKDVLNANPLLNGFNVTIPHKENIIPLLADISDEARAIGAVNVVKVINEGGKKLLKGYNSDIIGFVNSIKPLINRKVHTKALVLGTGGASKAIAYGLKKIGLEIQLVSRRKSGSTITYDEIDAELLAEYKVIVNCTPLGTFPNISDAPEMPYNFLTSDNLLYDLVYNPVETGFLRRGRENGAVTKNGVEMLELQALEAWRIWNE